MSHFILSVSGLLTILLLMLFMMAVAGIVEMFFDNEEERRQDMAVKLASKDEAKSYYLNVKKKKTIYVWGFNYNQIITKESIDKAYRDYHSARYDRAYYDGKLAEGKGKPGADCSGMHYKLSGYDTTAQGYYNKCTERGEFNTLPINEIVLLFKGSSASNLTHTGVYLGNGLCIHMKSSKANCVQESVDNHGWTHWGKANFIDYNTEFKTYKSYLTRILKLGNKGADVKLLQQQLNSKGFECGTVDGAFGKKTKTAVEKFQTSKKLEVTGIVDETTAKKLGFKVTY